MRHLSLDQVRTLVEVIGLGGFSAAARKLNLTQPAISQQVKELEARLGVRLVDRVGHKAYPTPAGAELVERGKRLLGEAEGAESAMRRYREGWLGRVRLGTAAAVATYLLPSVLGNLLRDHPTLEVIVRIAPTDRVVAQVLANELDIGLATLPVAETKVIQVLPVREDPMLAAFPAAMGDLPKEATPAFLATQTLILNETGMQMYRIVRQWFEAAGLAPEPAMQLGNSEAMKALVAAGAGVSILPVEREDDPLLSGKAVLRPLRPRLMRRLGLVMRRDTARDEAFTILRDALLTLSNI